MCLTFLQNIKQHYSVVDIHDTKLGELSLSYWRFLGTLFVLSCS